MEAKDVELLIAPVKQLIERQAIASERIANVLEWWRDRERETKAKVLGRGYFKKEDLPDEETIGIAVVHVGVKGGGLFYTVDQSTSQPLAFDADVLEFCLRDVKVIYKPSRGDRGITYQENWKLRLIGVSDQGRVRLESGAASGFTACIVEPLLEYALNPKSPIAIAPKRGSIGDAVLAEVLEADGQRVPYEKRSADAKWREVWREPVFQFVQKVKQVNDLPFPHRSAEEFYVALMSGEAGSQTSGQLGQKRTLATSQVKRQPLQSEAQGSASLKGKLVDIQDLSYQEGTGRPFIMFAIASASCHTSCYAWDGVATKIANLYHKNQLVEAIGEYVEDQQGKRWLCADEISPAVSEAVDVSELLAAIGVQIDRLKLSKSEGSQILQERYRKKTRAQLDEHELADFLSHLESMQTKVLA